MIVIDKENYCYDATGEIIEPGDIVEFRETHGCHKGNIWRSVVVFEDGVFTIASHTTKQIRNPDNWNQKHNWVNSRWCPNSHQEYGTWNAPCKPLHTIAPRFGEKYDDFYKPLGEKFGYGKRYLNCLVVGKSKEPSICWGALELPAFLAKFCKEAA